MDTAWARLYELRTGKPYSPGEHGQDRDSQTGKFQGVENEPGERPLMEKDWLPGTQSLSLAGAKAIQEGKIK